MYSAEPSKIEFPPLDPEDLIRLGEDWLRIHAIHRKPEKGTWSDYVRQRISEMVSRGKTSRTGLSSEDAITLAEVFRNVIPERIAAHSDPYARLLTHALLRGSRIFPGLELCEEPLDYTPLGFTDIWKGEYNGEPVCIKVVREQRLAYLRKIEGIYRHVVEESKLNPHPNVLPIIRVSEVLFPVCIMSPWMSNGNIVQYIQVNPGADRLMLLAQTCRGLMHLHGKLKVSHGSICPKNILITEDGQACLGDFAIAGVLAWCRYDVLQPENLQYMAPERFVNLDHDRPHVVGYSTEADVYSFAMTSFSVLTGALPYRQSKVEDMITKICTGRRPSRPRNPSENRWLPDAVWDIITIGWRAQGNQRCKLFAIYLIFALSNIQEVQNFEPNEGNRTPQTLKRRLGKMRPRIALPLESLQNWESEIQRQVNEMNERLEDGATSDQERPKLLNELCKTCSRHRVIPTSMHIPDCSEDSVEVESGGYADVSQGMYKGRRVAIKVVRMYITSDLDLIRSRFCREGVAWKHLRHPNVLPLLGVTLNEHRFALVSEWMDNGNINEFIKKNLDTNRAELLAGVASGLKYMHELHVVHGDLKGANILINKDRRACLADFGLSTITGVATHAGASQASLISNNTLVSFTGGGTRRWMSPELLHPERFGIPASENNRPTRQSDCYALGMVIYEVLCGHHPYLEFESDIFVVHKIMEGVRPEKPNEYKHLGFSDELWRTVELCWLEDRNARPGIEDIFSCLNNVVEFWDLWRVLARDAGTEWVR